MEPVRHADRRRSARRLDEAESRYVNAYNVHALTTALEEFRPDVVYVCKLVGLGGLGLMACLQYLERPLGLAARRQRPAHALQHAATRSARTWPREFSRQIRGPLHRRQPAAVERIEATGITLNGQVEVIPNWITGERPPSRDEVLPRAATSGSCRPAGSTRHKGIDLLIEAAARLRDGGFDDFAVDIYGKVIDA